MATVINFAYDHRATVAVVLQLPTEHDYFGCPLIIYILIYIYIYVKRAFEVRVFTGLACCMKK